VLEQVLVQVQALDWVLGHRGCDAVAINMTSSQVLIHSFGPTSTGAKPRVGDAIEDLHLGLSNILGGGCAE
jgi:hypothetical protein